MASLTARERNNPPPRRKSCAGCIKAKRRCDFALPSCMRCSNRNIPCEYSSRARRPRTGGPNPQQHEHQQGGDPLAEDNMQPEFFRFDTPQTEARVQLEDSPDIITTTAMHTSFEKSLDAIEQAIDNGFPALTYLDIPETEVTMQLSRHSMTVIASAEHKELASWSLRDIIEKRLQYSIDAIKLAPITMAKEMHTPWSHPLLFRDGLPRPMQDAHASCAMYVTKNPITAPIIMRTIDSRLHDLIDSPTPLNKEESLIHTQALLLYCIILLFDDDISSRATAGRCILELETSAIGLLSFANWNTDANAAAITQLPFYPLGPTKTFWKEWILDESIRRTLLFTFYYIQIYRLLIGAKGMTCDGRLGLCHTWTVSAHLWNARTPVDFARAWNENNHFTIKDSDFSPILREAMAHDIDSFGRIFISSLLGIEEADGWFASRGGSLRQIA